MDSGYRRRSSGSSGDEGRSGLRRSASPPRKRRVVNDTDPRRARERQRQEEERQQLSGSNGADISQGKLDSVEEYKKLMEVKSGGRYVPPAKLRALQAQISASESPKQYQRIQWDKLKKSINGSINKVNKSNIKEIAIELFKSNIIRGRGVLVRSVMKAQAFSRSYTPVYASLMAIINSKFPEIGDLLIKRLIIQFRRSFKRKDKIVCLNTCVFIAHLCNQQVAHEILCLQILHLLLQKPNDDLVEIAVAFVRESGAYLSTVSAPAFQGVFDRFTAVLHEGNLDKRVEYMIEALFQVRRENFAQNPIIPEGLDLVEEDDQETHLITLDDEGLKGEETLNIFKFDENYEQTEKEYDNMKETLFGQDSNSSDSAGDSASDSASDSGRSDSEADSDSDSESHESDRSERATVANGDEARQGASSTGRVVIRDMTDTQLVNLKKAVYLSIMSTMSVDEICHKLLKIDVSDEHKIEVVNMIVECCAQEKIYNRIYGLVGSRFCRMSRPLFGETRWGDLFIEAFAHYYDVIHRYETNKLRNMAIMFGYMLASDSLSWSVFEVVKMNERDSTSSSRIFVKILFQEMQQELGIKELAVRFNDSYHKEFLGNLMPKDPDRPEDTRFAINYFTAINLGVLTEDMREFLDSLPSPRSSSLSSRGRSRSSSYSGSYTGSSRSRSASVRGRRGRRYSRSNSASGSDSRSRSYSSRSRSYSSRSRSYSSRSGSYSRSRSRSRSTGYSRSRSKSRSKSRSRSQKPRDHTRSASPRRRYSIEPSPRPSPGVASPPVVSTEPPDLPASTISSYRDVEKSSGARDSTASRNRPKASDYL